MVTQDYNGFFQFPGRHQSLWRSRIRCLPDGRPVGEEGHRPSDKHHFCVGPRHLQAPRMAGTESRTKTGRWEQARVLRRTIESRTKRHWLASRLQQGGHTSRPEYWRWTQNYSWKVIPTIEMDVCKRFLFIEMYLFIQKNLFFIYIVMQQ